MSSNGESLPTEGPSALERFEKVISVLTNIKTLFAAGSLITVGIGVSRVGFGRAVGLALRSRFRIQNPPSVRTTELRDLRNYKWGRQRHVGGGAARRDRGSEQPGTDREGALGRDR